MVTTPPPRRVMLADDTEDMRVLLRMVLLGADFTVVAEAKDGPEALEAWRQTQPPELYAVILDQRMPGLEGLDVAKEILRECPDQRVVLFSAEMTSQLQSAALAIGVSVCLSKEQVLSLPQIALRDADSG